MAKIVLTDVTNITGQEAQATASINANSAAIETAIENTLSRDGTSPNSMNASIDMNDNDLINVGSIQATSLQLDGTEVITSDLLAKGDTGDAATIAVGTVTTGAAGTSVIVTNSGTTHAAVFDITIPRGDTGASGAGTGDMLKASNLSDVVSASTAFTNIKQAATTSATGVVELATDAEAQALASTSVVLTPSNLAAVTATETRTGVVELATTTEVVTGTDTARAVTPAGVTAALADLDVVLLKSGTISGSAPTIDFSANTGYTTYKFFFDGVTAASGSNQLFLAMGAGGTDTGGSDYSYNRLGGFSSSSSITVGNQTGASEIAISPASSLGIANFELTLFNPLNASGYATVKCQLVGTKTSGGGAGTSIWADTWGQRNAVKAISRIRLRYDGANISAGNYRLYGYK